MIYDLPPSPQYSPPSPSYSTSWIPTLKHSLHAAEDCPPSPTFSPLSPVYTPLSPRFHHSPSSLKALAIDHPNPSQAQSNFQHRPTTPPHPASAYLPTPPETPEEAHVKALAANEASEAANTLLTLLHAPVAASKITAVSYVDQARSMLGLHKPSFPTINLSHQPKQLEHTHRPILSSSHSSSLPHRHANTTYHNHLPINTKANPNHPTPNPSHTQAVVAAQNHQPSNPPSVAS